MWSILSANASGTWAVNTFVPLSAIAPPVHADSLLIVVNRERSFKCCAPEAYFATKCKIPIPLVVFA